MAQINCCNSIALGKVANTLLPTVDAMVPLIGSVDFNGRLAINPLNPVNPQHLTTKSYVDLGKEINLIVAEFARPRAE
jgi:hypothetical protein